MRPLKTLFLFLAFISFCFSTIVISYKWGFIAASITYGATSMPTYIAIFYGIPFIILTILFLVLAFKFRKKKEVEEQ